MLELVEEVEVELVEEVEVEEDEREDPGEPAPKARWWPCRGHTPCPAY